MKMLRNAVAIATTLTALTVGISPAAAVVLDFEGVALSGGTGSNTAVQNYLNSVLGVGFVTVSGAVADQAYDGDGFVNKVSGRFVTLGTTNGATSPTDGTHFHAGLDTFIRNAGSDISGTSNTPWGSTGNDKFVLVFRDPIYAISFDWEVFPDGTCGSCTGGPNFPDFELRAGVNGAGAAAYTFGPGAPFTVGVAPNGFAQGIGTFSTTFASGVTRLEFVDWPQRIGIDRLDPTRVPEPGAISLLGLALITLVFARRRRPLLNR
ncbi:MAG TPA: PEP-CTERM sorting domain-containing protein [Burkholderiales bacterium]|nr:PEP-CTERM sorting domain-containing protein [Burkholderiales bacterium]